MASGFEVVRLALAVFPILVEGLRFYMEKKGRKRFYPLPKRFMVKSLISVRNRMKKSSDYSNAENCLTFSRPLVHEADIQNHTDLEIYLDRFVIAILVVHVYCHRFP